MTTTIEVTERTWTELNRRKSPGQSFDDVVVSLLDEENSAEESTDRISEGDK